MDDAATDGDGYCLRAVTDLQLGKNISHMHLYGIFRNREFAGDLFVSLSSGHQGQDSEFARADLLVGNVLSQRLGHGSRKAALSRMNATNDFQ